MKLRSALMRDLQKHIEARGWKQAEASKAFHVTQPCISDPLRGKISLFSPDSQHDRRGTRTRGVRRNARSAVERRLIDSLVR